MKKTLVPLLSSCLLATASVAEETAAPQPNFEGLVLAVHGGPAAVDVEVQVNGEFSMTVVEDPALFTPIHDLLKPGLNTLSVSLQQPDSPRPSERPIELAVVQTEEKGRAQSTVGRPLAEITVPADAPSGCAETLRFWVGPPPIPPPPLKNQYWLFVSGPPVGVRVATRINGTVVSDASSGTRFVDVTPFVVKGKNTVELESRPTCLVEKSGQERFLVVEIGAAYVDVDTVKQTEPPQVFVEFAPKKNPQPETIKRTFRAN